MHSSSYLLKKVEYTSEDIFLDCVVVAEDGGANVSKAIRLVRENTNFINLYLI